MADLEYRLPENAFDNYFTEQQIGGEQRGVVRLLNKHDAPPARRASEGFRAETLAGASGW